MLKVLEKNKDNKWYESVNDMYMTSNGIHTMREDYHEKLKLYRFFNNDLQDYKDVLNKICYDPLSTPSADELLLSFNKIRNKYDILHGELLRRGNNHKIILLTAKAVRHKNEEFLAKLKENVEKDLQIVLSEAIETLQSMSRQELEQYIEEERQVLTPRDINYKSFLSDAEIYKNKMLKYVYSKDNILSKKCDTFQHQFISSEFYLKNSWRHGKPTIELCNPLYIQHHKSGNERKISKSDWVKYSDEITIGTALDEYVNYLSKTEIEEIIEYGGNIISANDPRHIKTIMHDYTQFRLAQSFRSGTGNQNSLWGLSESESNLNYLFGTTIKRTHIEFKAWDELIFYTTKDSYGDKMTVVLENKVNLIPKSASKVKYINEYFQKDTKYIWSDEFGDHEVIIKWVPQRYEMTSLGNNTLTQKRKVPFQPQYSKNPISSFCLSYKGVVLNNVNSKACSRMENAIPSQLQILALKQLQNKEIGKYRGFTLGRDISQIPMELAQDKDNPSDILTNVDVIGKKTGTEYYDSEQSKNGIPSPNRGAPLIPMQLGSPDVFIALQQAIQLLDMEVGLNCGVSPSREGQMVQGTNVTDNQQSLVQTSLATERDYYEHSLVWNEALDECLIAWDMYFRDYFEKNPDTENTFLEYSLPDGTRELIEVIPEYVEHSEMGLYLQDTYSDREYKEMMKLQINQNTVDIDMLTRSAINKAISSGASTEEIHREVQMLTDQLKKEQERRIKQEQEMAAQLKKDQMEMMAYENELNIEAKVAELIEKRITTIEAAELNAANMERAADVDKNKIADSIEKEKIKQENENKRQEKELDFKREELKVKEKSNKN